MKIIIMVVLSMVAMIAQSEEKSSMHDWRHDGSPAEKVSNLVQLVPGTSHWMAEMGARYQNLYWAAKQEKWDFAHYQLEEMESLVHIVSRARPGRAETAAVFLDKAIEPVEHALADEDWRKFEKAFSVLRAECMACHAKNDHSFIVLPEKPIWASSPVLNMTK
ncbi:hypothetical protein [Amphritea japonica]|uniref:Cytochrome c n=1 Tax=Amphritea japonica ATCC BAA-1530 TaxID=1278309 RepID=A0A7R6P896_9GAMM|nr:hypothetical protein [Amphritea japonica]BBB27714.1 conserved hypothetical protein [Amphritea japonica ATCC BAA-1530]